MGNSDLDECNRKGKIEQLFGFTPALLIYSQCFTECADLESFLHQNEIAEIFSENFALMFSDFPIFGFVS